MGEGRAGVLLDVDGTLLDTNYLAPDATPRQHRKAIKRRHSRLA